jgi:tetratricopeptide (TPR) repeat protein
LARFNYSHFFLLFLLISLCGCVTEKRRGEVSTFGKFYHNTTAKFNGYFNANELLKESTLALTLQHQDNYKQLLDVYEYVAVSNPRAEASNLDKAIEKVTVVVNLHRVSHWTDDCYLLIGKAQYLKQDYEAAEETLRYLINEFSPEKMAQAKKQSKKGADKSKNDAAGADGERKREELSPREIKKLEKEYERERKRYNKEVRKRMKLAKKNRKKLQERIAKQKAKEDKKATPASDSLSHIAEALVAPLLPEEAPTPPPDELVSIADKALDQNPEDADPDNNFLKHRPAYQEGLLWLARAYIERQKFDDASRLLAQLERDPKTYKDIRREIPAVKAHLFLRQKEYNLAIPSLDEAIAVTNKRSRKARYAFIKAQLYQQAGRSQEAFAAFEQALKFTPNYEMAFNGRLFMVENGWRQGLFSADEAVERLERMSRDFKNQEYLDQIYYSLADIALAKGNRSEGIRNLQLSLANSKGNNMQKGESYLRLAHLYLEEEAFVPAQRYFDSTLQVMPNSDERYASVKRWAGSLEDIAKNIEIIQFQDSMLRYAELSDKELKALAFQVKKERDEKRLQEIAQASAQNSGAARGGGARLDQFAPASSTASLSPAGGGAPRAAASTFFAYDERAVRRGQRDFASKWGGRPLEDDWRRANKRISGGFSEDAGAPPIADVAKPIADDEINSILGPVPRTEAEKMKAQVEIQNAMLKLGILYRERLENHRKSIDVLENLNERFPRSNVLLDSWYHLYLAYKELGDNAKAQLYADKIMERYPGSVYANVIRNPNYAADMANAENRLNRYYEETYAAFTSGNFSLAYQRSMEAPRHFGAQNPMQAKFALLSAMSAGNLHGKEAYVEALRDLITRYPNTNEQKRAREILRLLGETSASLPGEIPESVSEFKLEEEQLHYIIVAFKEDSHFNDGKIAISNYNLKYHKLDKLRISNVYLGNEVETRVPIIVIRRFNNKNEAMMYYKGAHANGKEFLDPKISFEMFAVSQNNYREILRAKSLESYREFFLQYYID